MSRSTQALALFLAAFLCAWYPGEGFAPALADVLAGDREPGGRLPVTLAAREDDYPAFDLTPDAAGDVRYSEGWLIGQPHRDSNGHVDNAVLILHGTGGTGTQFLNPGFAGVLFVPGGLLDASKGRKFCPRFT